MFNSPGKDSFDSLMFPFLPPLLENDEPEDAKFVLFFPGATPLQDKIGI